jgi:hypothetical protein
MARSNPRRKTTVQASCKSNAAILGSHTHIGGRFLPLDLDLVSTILLHYQNESVTFRLVFVNHWGVSPKLKGSGIGRRRFCQAAVEKRPEGPEIGLMSGMSFGGVQSFGRVRCVTVGSSRVSIGSKGC